MAGDINPSSEPGVSGCDGMFKKSFQANNSAWMPCQAGVYANRHHSPAFTPQHVEAIDGCAGKIISMDEIADGHEPHVVGDE